MKIKMSLSFLLSGIVVLLNLSQLFKLIPALFTHFSLQQVASLLEVLLPVTVVMLLYVNQKRAVSTVAAVVLLIGGAAQFISLATNIDLVMNAFSFDFIPMASTLSTAVYQPINGLLMITGALCMLKKKNNAVLKLLLVLGSCALALNLGLHITALSEILLNTAVKLAWLVAVYLLPATLYDYEHCAVADKRSLTVIAVVAIVVFLAPRLLGSPASSGLRCAQANCPNTAVTSGDSVYCADHSNHCGNCGCYIDGDAMFCMKCIENALK